MPQREVLDLFKQRLYSDPQWQRNESASFSNTHLVNFHTDKIWMTKTSSILIEHSLLPVPSHFSPLFKFFKRIKILFIYLYIYIHIQVLNLFFLFFMMNFIIKPIFQNQVNFMIDFTIKIITCFCCMLFFPTKIAYQEVRFL